MPIIQQVYDILAHPTRYPVNPGYGSCPSFPAPTPDPHYSSIHVKYQVVFVVSKQQLKFEARNRSNVRIRVWDGSSSCIVVASMVNNISGTLPWFDALRAMRHHHLVHTSYS